MSTSKVIERMHAAGFILAVNDAGLSVSPADRLSDRQRQWLRAHKAEILAALRATRTSESVLEAGQAGNDVEAANDRVIVHVPEFAASSGSRYSFDLSVPRVNLPLLRRSLRFQLRNGHGGSLLGSPGTTAEELRAVLLSKYAGGLESINGDPP